VKDIHDVIKLAKFGDDRLRGSGVVVGQISAFPIDFAGRPYNTLTLSRERVITNYKKNHFNKNKLTQHNKLNRHKYIITLCGTHLQLAAVVIWLMAVLEDPG